ncbi:MAG: hypothetical protein AB7O74_05905 [Candidatus Nanopelagicales bacterium]
MSHPSGARPMAGAHLATGALLVAVPGPDGGRSLSTTALTRVLAARHALEAIWLVRTDRPSAHRWAAAVEVVHIASMAVWRPHDVGLRAFARRGAVTSTVLLAAHLVQAVR